VRNLLAVLALLLVSARPAHAGNWAVTSIDPLPSHFEVRQTYVISYWTQPHGPTSLTLSAGRAVFVFPAIALPEPGHYSAAVSVPAADTWNVIASLGTLQPYSIGTLRVPGSFTPAQTSPWPTPLLAVIAVTAALAVILGVGRLGRHRGASQPRQL
jgi:hypothetical protein